MLAGEVGWLYFYIGSFMVLDWRSDDLIMINSINFKRTIR